MNFEYFPTYKMQNANKFLNIKLYLIIYIQRTKFKPKFLKSNIYEFSLLDI